MKREPKASLSETVYQAVKADIFGFRLLPGARFSENAVAERARVSRTPVREALYRLEREGFLSVHAKSGWTVRPLDFDQYEHLYDVRIILELAAVRSLFSGEIPETLAPLKKVWAVPLRQRVGDWAEVARLDEAFHMTLVSATGNPELARIHADITERIRIVRRLDFTYDERVACTYEEHAGILAAILARKTQQAQILLRAHIEQSKLEVRKIGLHKVHLAHFGSK
jgi:DNA-binding GntR family transcriptional regulator